MTKIPTFFVLSLLFLCSACSTITTDLETDGAVPSTVAVDTQQKAFKREVVGQGPVKIEILLPQNSDLKSRQRASEIAQGAKLSQQDLGANQLSLLFDSVENAETSEFSRPGRISSQSPKFGVLLSGQETLPAYTERSYPVITIKTNDDQRPPNTYAFLASETDSLIAGIKHALTEKQGSVALIIPPHFSLAKIARIRKEIGEKHQLNIVSYVASETAAQAAKRATSVDNNTKIFAFGGDDLKIELMAKSINSLKGIDKDFVFVGNMNWPASFANIQALNGSIVANLDRSSSKLIASRYQEKFGKPITVEAMYGYDMIAVVAGLIRSKGVEGLNKSGMFDPIGFRGVTGAFRFKADGSIERIYTINKIQNTRLVPIANLRNGF